MPKDLIRISPNASPEAQLYATKLLTATKALRSVIDQLEECKAVMDHANDGVDFTQIETLFGLSTNRGQMVYDLVNGTLFALKGQQMNNNAISLIDRVG